MKIRTYLLLADDSNGKCLYRRKFSMVSTFIAPSSNHVSKIQPPIRMISTSNFVRIWNAEKNLHKRSWFLRDFRVFEHTI